MCSAGFSGRSSTFAVPDHPSIFDNSRQKHPPVHLFIPLLAVHSFLAPRYLSIPSSCTFICHILSCLLALIGPSAGSTNPTENIRDGTPPTSDLDGPPRLLRLPHLHMVHVLGPRVCRRQLCRRELPKRLDGEPEAAGELGLVPWRGRLRAGRQHLKRRRHCAPPG